VIADEVPVKEAVLALVAVAEEAVVTSATALQDPLHIRFAGE
jgi:hypothetical protein